MTYPFVALGFCAHGKKIGAESLTRGTKGTPKLFARRNEHYAGTRQKRRRASTRVLLVDFSFK